MTAGFHRRDDGTGYVVIMPFAGALEVLNNIYSYPKYTGIKCALASSADGVGSPENETCT